MNKTKQKNILSVPFQVAKLDKSIENNFYAIGIDENVNFLSLLNKNQHSNGFKIYLYHDTLCITIDNEINNYVIELKNKQLKPLVKEIIESKKVLFCEIREKGEKFYTYNIII